MRNMTREQRWLFVSDILLILLAIALLSTMVWSVTDTTRARQEQVNRTEEIADELHQIAQRLDDQTSQFESQTNQLESQADILQSQANRLDEQFRASEASRAQFRQAVRDLFDLLGAESDPFETSGASTNTTSTAPSPAPVDSDPDPPDPTMDNGKPCPETGRGPSECRDP